MVSKGRKTAADAARLFKVRTAAVSRLLAWAYAQYGTRAASVGGGKLNTKVYIIFIMGSPPGGFRRDARSAILEKKP